MQEPACKDVVHSLRGRNAFQTSQRAKHEAAARRGERPLQKRRGRVGRSSVLPRWGPACWTPTTTGELCAALPVQLDGELELAGIVGGAGLARGADAARRRVAQLVHGKNVRVVEEVEPIGDQVQTKTLAKVDALGKAQVELKEIRHPESIAAEAADATKGWRRPRNGECRKVGQVATGRLGEGYTMDVGR